MSVKTNGERLLELARDLSCGLMEADEQRELGRLLYDAALWTGNPLRKLSPAGALCDTQTVDRALAASQPVGNYEVQTENGPLKCSLAVYAEWQKNEEYIERLKAELAARQPVGELHLPPDGFYKIVFDDAEVPDESFARSGALDAALRRFEQISNKWNAHLFVRFANNTRDCTVPNATPAQAVDLGAVREAVRKAWQKCAAGESVDLQFGTLLALIDSRTVQTAQAVEMSPEFTDTARAAIAWVLWHHQGGSSPVGQPLRFALGMGQHDRMTDHQIAEAKRFAAWANVTTEDFHQRTPAQAVDLAPDHRGMRVDYHGLLGRSQEALRQRPELAEMLRQLHGHLTEMGKRWYAGDRKVVDEFLQLYGVEDGSRRALISSDKAGQ